MPTYDFQQAAETVAAIAAQHAAETDGGNFPKAALAALAETGLYGLVSATDVGGKGLGLREAAYVVERIARECGSTAMIACMHYSATAVIEAHGPKDVRTAIASGKHLATLAFSEPGSRSQFWASLGTATADGANVRLTGKKSFATSAHHADSYVWSSKPVAGSEMTTLWLVPRTTPGIRIDKNFDGLGLRGNDSAPITAEAAAIPSAARLGGDGEGFGIMMSIVLPWFNVMSCGVSAGLMETLTTRTAAHAGAASFEHAGQRLADLPTIRAFIARMRCETDMIHALLSDTLVAISTGRADATLRVLESKAAAGESASEVADIAMRVCGGSALRKDLAVERVYRDARAAMVMGPTTDVLYDFIGKVACGLPLF
jgi:alkylation response protein AidB-like acyl-CoA dehydrogenase